MYGESITRVKRFGFISNSETAVEDFDNAVKEINKIYHESGHFRTKEEVNNHFKKYGFTEIYL
jgi:hypothetical protein